MIDKDLICKIIEVYNTEEKHSSVSLSDYLYLHLKGAESTKNSIYKLEMEKVKVQQKADVEIKEINKQIEEIRSKCHHWSTQYHPDPSGNNDSYYECTICGKET